MSEKDENCCCETCEEEISIKKLIFSAILFIVSIFIEHFPPLLSLFSFTVLKTLSLTLYAISYLLCGMNVLREALESLFKGKCFNEEFLMALATVGAIIVGEYSEAVAVMLLFEIGEFLEHMASEKTRKSVSSLMSLRPEVAHVSCEGKTIEVDPEEVHVGDIIVVQPGERVPLDGKVTSGSSLVDTSSLTGESLPREITVGSQALSGFVCTTGVIHIQVEKEFSQSTVSRLLELVESSQEKKAKTERFITRFAKVYTPLVCLIAFLIAFLPPILLGGGDEWKRWIYRACEMLVVSCPCALVISVPLSFFAGIGNASCNGVLIKGATHIETLSHVKTVVFDKTGTLTKGILEVTDVCPSLTSGVSKETLSSLATHAEYYSKHPIALSLRRYHKCPDCGKLSVSDAHEIPGQGIKCMIQGETVLAGNKKLMLSSNVEGFSESENEGEGSVIYIAQEGKFLGHIKISDTLKDDSFSSIEELRSLGVRKTIMLTGDSEKTARKIAEEASIDEVYSELLPEGKVLELEAIIEREAPSGGKVMFVGDGINDAPVISRSDVGVAMGALGSDAALEASDVVIMNDSMMKIPLAIRLSRRTICNVRENIVFSLGMKLLILVLCASGKANMWLAVFGDVGVCMLAVLNSMRLLSKKSRK